MNKNTSYEVMKGLGGRGIIKSWTKGVNFESQARDQLKNLASLPFIHKHVAAMPDVHLGRGATIGSVIATKGAIIPAAVGVDIGCFTIDTEVELVNGVRKTFAELIEMDQNGEDIYGYALDINTNKICMTKYMAPRKTRTAKNMIKIILDNEQSIECTPDHLFYMRNGDEIRADKLSADDTLMPLYTKTDNDVEILETQRLHEVSGYDVIYQPQNDNWSYAHRLADDYNQRNELVRVPKEKGWCRHHNDFIKTNNLPTNIIRIGRKEHWKIHSDHAKQNNQAGISGFGVARKQHPEFFARMASDNMKKLHNDPIFASRRDARALKRIRELNAKPTEGMLAWRNHPNRPKINNSDPLTIQAQRIGKIRKVIEYLVADNITVVDQSIWNEYRTKVYNGKKWSTVCKILHNEGITALDGVIFQLNHTVRSVEYIQYDVPIEVYCLTSPEFHTFSLGAGVFVHNCGMNAVRLSLTANDLPDSLVNVRGMIERMVPVGHDYHTRSRMGSKWHNKTDKLLNNINQQLEPGLQKILAKHPTIGKIGRDFEDRAYRQIGTLGGGNHFIELCLDENDDVWVMLHSGSRNPGNCIGNYFIGLAKKEMERFFIQLPDKDLAYLAEGTLYYDDYIEAVGWAQDFAYRNRQAMMELVIVALERQLPDFRITSEAVNAHHNYVSMENHFGANVHVTRKGAIRARVGDYGIIPGSMGARSFIVRGLGNKDSFCSAPHGAGRNHSRSAAKRLFTVEDHEKATAGIECRKDAGVLDETPMAYKDIDQVIAAAGDLVEIVHTLRQVVCVKG